MSVRCGNKIHAGTRTNHASAAEVKACFTETPKGWDKVEGGGWNGFTEAPETKWYIMGQEVDEATYRKAAHALPTGRFEDRLTEIERFGASAVADATVTGIDKCPCGRTRGCWSCNGS